MSWSRVGEAKRPSYGREPLFYKALRRLAGAKFARFSKGTTGFPVQLDGRKGSHKVGFINICRNKRAPKKQSQQGCCLIPIIQKRHIKGAGG